ncbi:unnamed protein product [Musa acuminata subsp. malaccensis]|uniref:(wild Malaysian banana) hypothetical protein n=1 Tax=Musa acuminata subsp. malaccensis TaxID=214687 RepID=A0A804KH15_MUSAM|nr:PREDICTED: ribonuclease 1-like [Musa acuminata subsp. malaccensis]CAG1834490.1 unnamed protein product [Musa acuminata subsp. malaccensis]
MDPATTRPQPVCSTMGLYYPPSPRQLDSSCRMAILKALPGICLLVLLLCLSSSPAARAASKPDYLILKLMWPGSYCASSQPTGKCCMPTNGEPAADFLVQALETYDSATGKPVTGCSRSCVFKILPLVNMLDNLYTYYANLTCPSNSGMPHWKDVWCTYGTCSSLNQSLYFDRALQLRKKVDPLVNLGSSGIIPHATKSYSLDDINDALVPRIGFSFTVVCTRNYILWPFFYEDYLYQIRVCVSSDGRSIIGCPNGRESNCGDTVKFPPVSYPLQGREDDAVSKTVIELPSGDEMAL